MPMARLYANAGGVVLRVVTSAAQEERYGAPPGTALQLAFDTATNPDRLPHLLAHRGRYLLAAGPPTRLLLDGAPVALNPPGPLAQLRAKCHDLSPLVVVDAQEVKALGRLLFRLLDSRPQ